MYMYLHSEKKNVPFNQAWIYYLVTCYVALVKVLNIDKTLLKNMVGHLHSFTERKWVKYGVRI